MCGLEIDVPSSAEKIAYILINSVLVIVMYLNTEYKKVDSCLIVDIWTL